jgi:hypothetical protein
LTERIHSNQYIKNMKKILGICLTLSVLGMLSCGGVSEAEQKKQDEIDRKASDKAADSLFDDMKKKDKEDSIKKAQAPKDTSGQKSEIKEHGKKEDAPKPEKKP